MDIYEQLELKNMREGIARISEMQWQNKIKNLKWRAEFADQPMVDPSRGEEVCTNMVKALVDRGVLIVRRKQGPLDYGF
jgi:hypothetical protein